MNSVLFLVLISYKIVINPNTFNITLRAGKTLDTTLTITNNESIETNWSVEEEPNVGWLEVSPTSGSIPSNGSVIDTLKFTADTVNYQPGQYTCVLIYKFVFGYDTTYYFVPVYFTIEPVPAPRVTIIPDYFDVSVFEGDSTERIMTIGNIGDTTLSWTLIDTVNWLEEIPQNGTVQPNNFFDVTIKFNSKGISPGSYSTTLLLISNDPSKDTLEIPVNLEVIDLKIPDLHITPQSFNLTLTQGEDTTLVLTLNNSGDGALSWSIRDSMNVSWLTVSPTQGVVPETMSVEVNLNFSADRLSPSSYNTVLILSSNDPDSPTVYIPVQMDVLQGSAELSGVIHNLTINENFGYFDSSGFVNAGNVSLYDTSGNVIGPAVTDELGNYSLQNVPVEDYIMELTKEISLPDELPLNKQKDTVKTYISPIIIYPGTNNKNAVLPVQLVQGNYNLLAFLASLDFSIPEWDITAPLAIPYDVLNIQELIDEWTTTGIDTLSREGLARLWITEKLFNDLYSYIVNYGTEGVVGLSEILSLHLSILPFYSDILIKTSGDVEIGLTKYIFELFGRYFESFADRVSALGSPSLSNLLKWTWCNAYIEAIKNFDKNNYSSVSQNAFLSTSNNFLFSEYYVQNRTQPLLNNAYIYADSGGFSGDPTLAYTIMDYYRKTTQQRLKNKRDMAKEQRQSLSIPLTIKEIQYTVSESFGFEKLVNLGEILKNKKFSNYALSVGNLFEELDLIPDSLKDIVFRIFYPKGKFLTNSDIFKNKKIQPFTRNRKEGKIKPFQTSYLDDYKNYIRDLQTVLKNKDRDRLEDMFERLIQVDKEFEKNISEVVSKIYGASNIAKDSLFNFSDDYVNFGKELENMYLRRIGSFARLLFYYENPSVQNMNEAYYYLDTLGFVLQNFVNDMNSLLSEISSFINFPVVSIVDVEIDAPDFPKPGDSIQIKIIISNSGISTANDVSLRISSYGVSIPDSVKSIGSLSSGETKEVMLNGEMQNTESGFSGISINVNSSNSFVLHKIILIPVQRDITPSTGGKLSSKNVYAYKNPFNPFKEGTIIRFSLSKDANVTIKIYDAGNNEVLTLLKNYPMEAFKEQRVKWSGRNARGEIVANGVYYAVITTDKGERAVCKIVVLR